MELRPAHSQAHESAFSQLAPGTQEPGSVRQQRVPSAGLAPSLERRRLQLHLATVVIDALLLLGIFAAVAAIYQPHRPLTEGMLPAFVLLPLFQTIALYNATYSRDGLTNWRLAAQRAVAALAISAIMLTFIAFLLKANAEISRVIFGSSTLLLALALAGSRYLLSRLTIHRWGPTMTNRLLIQAGGPDVRIAHHYHVNATEHDLVPDLDDPVMLDRLARYLRNMDQVIVSCQPQDRAAWAEVLKGAGIHGEVISDFAREIGALGIVRHDNGRLVSLLVSTGRLGVRARAIKRLFDITSSAAALILFCPVMLLCAAAIVLEDGGPVFFRQRRVGRGNTFFDIYKFRSMHEERADTAGQRSAAKDDDRVTRVGRVLRRTSLDELPQLINVLKGDMSLVGPRPHALGSQAGDKLFWEVDRKYWQRHSLRPGITGLAQVRGLRGATDTEADLSDRLESDLEYLNSWSLLGDVKIVLATLSVLAHDRAF